MLKVFEHSKLTDYLTSMSTSTIWSLYKLKLSNDEISNINSSKTCETWKVSLNTFADGLKEWPDYYDKLVDESQREVWVYRDDKK